MKEKKAAESFFKLMNFGTFFYKNYLNPEETSVSLQRMGVLFTLFYKPDKSLKELAHLLGVSTSNLSVMVESMVKDELVSRKQDPADRRRVVLNLSEKGKEKFNQEKNNLVNKLDTWISKLSENEKEKFFNSCNFLIQHLSDV
jgi:DNA-binding MarR family transcriptional regulator